MIADQLTQYLIDKYRPVGIILFGSRATDDYHDRCDWDLFIFSDVTEDDVEDYAEYRGWNDQFLEVNILPAIVDDDFILDTATHPIRDIKILYDNSKGMIDRIVQRTKKAYEAGPEPLSQRKRELYKKILTKHIRKVESRKNQDEVLFFATSQFFVSATRYWFEVHQMWPQPIHKALKAIEEEDSYFVKNLKQLYDNNSSKDDRLTAMQKIREILFDL